MNKTSNELRSIIVIAHNLRSTHNVGSLFRTCEGLGVDQLLLSGYTPYPKQVNDSRLPHIADKLDRQIAKTALDAQKNLNWRSLDDLEAEIVELKQRGYEVIGLEQSKTSLQLTNFAASLNLVLILGNELEGIDKDTLELCDDLVEIPMFGKKESFNVVQAAAMALFYLRFS